jgi:ketol-acid reductoisomerase
MTNWNNGGITMNEGQQKFYDFVMERVKEGKEEEIKAIMNESFKRQQEGTFTKEYMAETVPEMILLLKPECVEEFKKAAEHMNSQLKK